MKSLSGCIAKAGHANAARPQSEGGCIGVIRQPCLPQVPNNAETFTCLSREDAAWVKLTDDALATAKTKLAASAYAKLTKRRAAWIKAMAKVCAPEEEGSMASVESEFCEQDEVARLAMDMVKRATP